MPIRPGVMSVTPPGAGARSGGSALDGRGLVRLKALMLAGLAAGCGDATAPEEARFPIVEGIYNVDTTILSNSCQHLNIIAGNQVFIFVQRGGRLEFRPLGFDEEGDPVLLDLGLLGEIRPDGRFNIEGSYTLSLTGVGQGGIVVGLTMEGQFDGNLIEGVQQQIPTFAAGSCEVTFSFTGEEV